jgi:hypothetical protein
MKKLKSHPLAKEKKLNLNPCDRVIRGPPASSILSFHILSGPHLLLSSLSEDYLFNLDPVRVPSKYPGKTNFRPGPNYGLPSGNPLGKNPSDVWKLIAKEWEVGLWNIPNVKANHPEKTLHPCQFPIELVERCVLAMTNEGDWVLDPFSGVGSAMLAAVRHNRRAMGCERDQKYIDEAKRRMN